MFLKKRRKLDAHTLEGTFVKYDGHSKAYNVIVFNIENYHHQKH